jgi:hypothetical protein
MSRVQCPHPECAKTYASNAGLVQHLNKKHREPGAVDKYVCQHCDKGPFACKSELEGHERRCAKNPTKSEWMFKCDDCDHCSPTKDILVHHQEKKHGTKRPSTTQSRNKYRMLHISKRYEVVEAILIVKGARWYLKDTQTGECFGELRARTVNQKRCDTMNLIFGLVQHLNGDLEAINKDIDELIADRSSQSKMIEEAALLVGVELRLVCVECK